MPGQSFCRKNAHFCNDGLINLIGCRYAYYLKLLLNHEHAWQWLFCNDVKGKSIAMHRLDGSIDCLTIKSCGLLNQ